MEKLPLAEIQMQRAETMASVTKWQFLRSKAVLFAIIGLIVLLGALLASYLYLDGDDTSLLNEQKVYRVGVLNALDFFSPVVDGFKEEMTALGYVEGKNIMYEIEVASAPVGNQAIIQKFIDDDVDLLLVFPTEASREALEIADGTDIPIIGVAMGVEGSGLVESVQNPGNQLTGVRFPTPEVASKRLQILHELVPDAARVVVPYLKDYPTVAPALDALELIAKPRGITVIEVPLTAPSEINDFFARHANKNDIDAIVMIPEPISTVPALIDSVHAFAEAEGIPVISNGVYDTDKGSVAGLIPSGLEMGQIAAPLAHKIFTGTPAEEIAVVTPELILSINLKAMERLQITPTENLLNTAHSIIH